MKEPTACLDQVGGVEQGDRVRLSRGAAAAQASIAATASVRCARHVPVVTIIINTPGRIAESFKIVDELTGDARAGHKRGWCRDSSG